MKILKAKFKASSEYYTLGINQKGKPLWLNITGFTVKGTKNFKVEAIRNFEKGHPQFFEIWVSLQEIIIKHIEIQQLSLELYTDEELEAKKYHPKIFNKKRFEVITENEKQYIQANNIEMAHKVAQQLDLSNYTLKPVKPLSSKELNQ